MKKQSKTKKIEPIPETYTCPICGNSHKNEELCPVVLKRQKKIKYDTQSYIMGSIFLECLEQGVNFFQIIKEVFYFIEELTLSSLSQRISLNADFVISYFASAIGCSPSKFFKKLPELAPKYDRYIHSAFTSIAGAKIDEHNVIEDICLELDMVDGPLGDMLENAGYHNSPKLYIHKVLNGRKPTYHLVMEYDWVEAGYRQKRNYDQYTKLYFYFSNICFGEHTTLDGYELYSEKEGKLKEIFESDFYWEDVADAISCSNSVAYDWTLKLDEATKKGLLKWDKDYNEYGFEYTTTYGKSKIQIQLVDTTHQENEEDKFHVVSYPHGDYIRIYENDRKMYHYGEVASSSWIYPEKHEEKSAELIQEPMLRRVARTVDKWEHMQLESGFIESRPKKAIRKADVLSVTYSFICSEKGHIVVPYCGLVPIITPDGEEIEEKVYLGYCRNCGVYYIFQRDYELLCKKGELQCKVIEAMTKKTLWDASFNFNEKSVLSEMGYNVQASTNLSTEERHQILRRAIEEKKISENEIINLLELQINLHSGNERYANAVEKWKEDADFVKDYGINSGRIKRVSHIQI